MATKNLTIRVDEALYNRLNTLKKVVKVSINQLVCQAVDKYVDEQSTLTAQKLQGIAQQLRSYRDSDPDLKKSLRSFAEAEGQYQDPLEGEVVDTAKTAPRTKLQELLYG
jgi:predicted transcriptional regulator